MSDRSEMSVSPVPEETVLEACGETPFPEMGVVEQVWEPDPIPDSEVAAAAAGALADLDFEDVPEGGEIAVGAGSRGINNLPRIVSGAVSGLQERGYEPFVFPAMGSHGGATAEGQRRKLDALGVKEETVGCEIRATMDTVEVGRTPDRDIPVVADANAAAADGILPINRIKPHTDFSGDVESGLSKMLVIGMGKQRGAKTAHEWSVDWSLRRMIPEISTLLREELPVVGGVAIVEDQHDDTSLVEGVPPSDFLDREAELLETAYERMPTIPFKDVDDLILDQIGKDISGAGMDTNVIGRMGFAFWEPEPEMPNIKRIFVRSITDPSFGNGIGMESADFAHADFLESLDLSKTLINGLTSSTPRGVRIPPVVETDRAGLTASLATIGIIDTETVRVIRATDTMRLSRFYASPALVEEARERDDLRVVSEPEPIAFTDGDFADPSLVPKDH